MLTQTIDYIVAIQKNSNIKLSTKLVLQELVSFELNPTTKVTFASDAHFATKFGISLKTVSRVFAELEGIGLLRRETIREAHASRYDGSRRKDTTRYTYINLEAVRDFLVAEPNKRIRKEKVQVFPSRANFEEDDGELSVLRVVEIPDPLPEPCYEYSYEAILELAKIDKTVGKVLENHFGEQPPTDDYLKGMFEHVIMKNPTYLEKYRAVFSEFQRASA